MRKIFKKHDQLNYLLNTIGYLPRTLSTYKQLHVDESIVASDMCNELRGVRPFFTTDWMFGTRKDIETPADHNL